MTTARNVSSPAASGRTSSTFEADTTGPRPVSCELEWDGDLRFVARTATAAFVLDSAGAAGPSPMQALAGALAGCMGMDVVHILERSRVPAASVRIAVSGDRVPGPPARFTAMRLHFEIGGPASAEQVGRALALSREKYCSVWSSTNPDIVLEITSRLIGG